MTKSTTAGRAGKANSKTPTSAAKKKATKGTPKGTTTRDKRSTPAIKSAPASEAAHARGDVRVAVPLLVSSIRPDPDQPRKHFVLDDILGTLECDDDGEPVVANGVSRGINDPITVRRAPDGSTEYMIIKGERRWRSAGKIGFTSIHAFIQEGELDATELRSIQLRENIARQDLEPLEIADAITDLIAESPRKKLPAAEVAARIGTTPAKVYRYRALSTLVTPVRVSLNDHTITEGIALELASVKPDQQPDALDLVRTLDLRQARNIIRNRFHLPLVDCGFDITDPSLTGGACEACPKNNKTQRSLWDQSAESDARCTDRVCYQAKKEEAWNRTKDEARIDGAKVVEGEAADEIFPSHYDPEPEGKLVDLDRPYFDDPSPPPEGPRTIRQILGDVRPSIVVRDKSGKVHALLTCAEAAEAMREIGEEEIAASLKADAEYEPPPPAPKRDYQAEHKALHVAQEQALSLILRNMATLRSALLWRWVAVTLVRADSAFNGEKIGDAAARRGLVPTEAQETSGDPWEPMAALLTWLEDVTADEARDLALELLVTSLGVSGDLDDEHPFESAARLAGVDFTAIRRETFTSAGLPFEEPSNDDEKKGERA